MDHLRNNSLASVSSTGAAGTSMFTVSDMTPETVISELNLFSKCILLLCLDYQMYG